MGGGKKNENENENGRKREFATDPRSKRAQEKNTPFGHTPHSDKTARTPQNCAGDPNPPGEAQNGPRRPKTAPGGAAPTAPNRPLSVRKRGGRNARPGLAGPGRVGRKREFATEPLPNAPRKKYAVRAHPSLRQ